MKFHPLLKRIHDWANHHEWLFLLWTVLIVLRLPNLVEPYWYGDEAIYLTIGTAMRHGLLLYKEIVDHKTPLIYFFAMVPNQLAFRFLMIGWMLVSTALFHSIAKKLFSSWVAFASALLFVLLTSLPAFEGHIPNGELFVMGFILLALWLLAKTTWWTRFTKSKTAKELTARDYQLVFAAGIVSSLGILTKVPALLDAGSLGAGLLFAFLGSTAWTKATASKNAQELIKSWIAFGSGIVLPIALSMVYFALRGTLSDYIQFGLLYNFHYTGNWTLPFENPVLLWLFTLIGKAIVLAGILAISLALTLRNKSQALLSWTVFWTGAALFGALLSNRPYPHYFQQVVPPLALLFGFFLSKKTSMLGRSLILGLCVMSVAILSLLNFRPYSIGDYYVRYFKLLTGKMSKTEYLHSFNWLVEQNEKLIPIIQEGSTEQDRIFIWGTNPMLYAQSKRSPASKFTVAFHIHDLKVYEQTMEELRTNDPAFIVVMKSESELSGLDELIREKYVYSMETQDMILYRKTSLSNLELLQ